MADGIAINSKKQIVSNSWKSISTLRIRLKQKQLKNLYSIYLNFMMVLIRLSLRIPLMKKDKQYSSVVTISIKNLLMSLRFTKSLVK
ncbi:hypothetical protein D3C71_1842260 [compost metagenome]